MKHSVGQSATLPTEQRYAEGVILNTPILLYIHMFNQLKLIVTGLKNFEAFSQGQGELTIPF